MVRGQMWWASASLVAVVVSAGCAERLTPARVRELLDEPKGRVSNESMAFITRDLFAAERGTSLESFAGDIRSSGVGSETANAAALSSGVFDGIGDVFCVGGLVAAAGSFDACALGDTCDAELTVDSCLLRVGDPGPDEDARGKLKFRLANTVDADFERSELGIEFEGWESSRDEGMLSAIAGRLAVETARSRDDSHMEFTFASDIDMDIKRKERGFFDDGVEDRVRLGVGARFVAESDDNSARGTLEVLASASADGDREESVTIRLEAEGRRVDAASATASASLAVVGENGTFTCSWSSTEERGTRDGLTVTSAGSCVDEDGETFAFEGTATGR